MTDPVDLQTMLRCARREVRFRRRVYATRVGQARMTQAEADHELATMEAIAALLQRLLEGTQLTLDLGGDAPPGAPRRTEGSWKST